MPNYLIKPDFSFSSSSVQVTMAICINFLFYYHITVMCLALKNTERDSLAE